MVQIRSNPSHTSLC